MTEPPHLCEDMARNLADERVPIVYLPRFREYGLKVAGSSAIQEIAFCPWDGERLPGSLRDALFDRLAELGLEPDDLDLPPELRTDAWWRADPRLTDGQAGS